jgi:hypothetical protein
MSLDESVLYRLAYGLAAEQAEADHRAGITNPASRAEVRPSGSGSRPAVHLGLGRPSSIPHTATASTARCHAAVGVEPSTRIWLSPLRPSTCQTNRPLDPVNAASPVN